MQPVQGVDHVGLDDWGIRFSMHQIRTLSALAGTGATFALVGHALGVVIPWSIIKWTALIAATHTLFMVAGALPQRPTGGARPCPRCDKTLRVTGYSCICGFTGGDQKT